MHTVRSKETQRDLLKRIIPCVIKGKVGSIKAETHDAARRDRMQQNATLNVARLQHESRAEQLQQVNAKLLEKTQGK